MPGGGANSSIGVPAKALLMKSCHSGAAVKILSAPANASATSKTARKSGAKAVKTARKKSASAAKTAQKRTAAARMFVRQPELLVFDDLSSALDGETEQRLYALSAWWETPFFTEAEQAALQLAEEVTRIAEKGLSDSTYQKALELFGEQNVAQIIFTTVVISSWNRIAISVHTMPERDEEWV